MAGVSLKMTPAEAKAEGYGSPAEIKPPEYPWGTVLTLTDEQVKALWPKGLPSTETKLTLDVSAYVKRVSVDEQGGEKRVSVDLQLTDIATETDADSDLSAADRLYGKDGPRK